MEAIAKFPKAAVDFIEESTKDAAERFTHAESACDVIKTYSFNAVVCLGAILASPIMLAVGLVAAAILGSALLCTSDEKTSKLYYEGLKECPPLAILGLLGPFVLLAKIIYPPFLENN